MNPKYRPEWLNKKIDFKKMHETEKALSGLNVHTVCHQARCPNISECFAKNTATFLILGDTCTRGCAYCAVKKGIPEKSGQKEPKKVLDGIIRLGLRYVVITSVTRDDLKDGGASVFAGCLSAIKAHDPLINTEVLVPDFMGDKDAVNLVLKEMPDVFGHNIETVPSLYKIRKGADYKRSLKVLEQAKKSGVRVKSAIMLGMGEKECEVLSAMRDLRLAGCDYLAIGQYLQPDNLHYRVKEYIHPEKFDYYKKRGKSMGFLHIESGPYVRSSYMAEEYLKNRLKFQLA